MFVVKAEPLETFVIKEEPQFTEMSGSEINESEMNESEINDDNSSELWEPLKQTTSEPKTKRPRKDDENSSDWEPAAETKRAPRSKRIQKEFRQTVENLSFTCAKCKTSFYDFQELTTHIISKVRRSNIYRRYFQIELTFCLFSDL